MYLSDRNLGGRIEVFDVEQLLATNIYERGLFSSTGRRIAVDELISEYNRLIEKLENDPSLKIATG